MWVECMVCTGKKNTAYKEDRKEGDHLKELEQFGGKYQIDILVNCIWVTPSGSSTVHIYTKQYTEQHN